MPSPSDVPSAISMDKLSQKWLASMDSHVLHSMLTTMLTDKTLLYDNLVKTAHHPVFNTGTDWEDPIELVKLLPANIYTTICTQCFIVSGLSHPSTQQNFAALSLYA
jgi:hypothetical protein